MRLNKYISCDTLCIIAFAIVAYLLIASFENSLEEAKRKPRSSITRRSNYIAGKLKNQLANLNLNDVAADVADEDLNEHEPVIDLHVNDGEGAIRLGAWNVECSFSQLLEWIRLNGGSHVSLEMAYRVAAVNDDVPPLENENSVAGDDIDLKNKGVADLAKNTVRTIRVNESVEPYQAVLSIPKILLLSSEKAFEGQVGATLTGLAKPDLTEDGTPDSFDYPKAIDTFFSLESIALAFQLVFEEALGTKSKYRDYICLLPRGEGLSVPLLWSTSRLTALSQKYKIDVTSRIQEERKHLAAIFDFGLRRLKKENAHLFQSGKWLNFDKVTVEKFVWAMAIVQSRSFKGPSVHRPRGEDNVLFLVPLLDMLNHQTEMPSSAMEMAVIKDNVHTISVAAPALGYQLGDEVVLSYGKRCNLEMILVYGFSAGSENTLDCKDSVIINEIRNWELQRKQIDKMESGN